MNYEWSRTSYGAAYTYYGSPTSHIGGVYPHEGWFEARIFVPYYRELFETIGDAKAWVEAIVALEYGV